MLACSCGDEVCTCFIGEVPTIEVDDPRFVVEINGSNTIVMETTGTPLQLVTAALKELGQAGKQPVNMPFVRLGMYNGKICRMISAKTI